MTNDYWTAVDDLARALLQAPSEKIDQQLVDKLLDVDAELLNRVVTNYGTDAYLAICEQVGIPDPKSALSVMLHPVREYNLIDQITLTSGESLLHQIHVELSGDGSGPNSTDALALHPTYQQSPFPSGTVLNTALSTLIALTMKLETLSPWSGPLDPTQPDSRYAKAIDMTIEHMRSRIRG